MLPKTAEYALRAVVALARASWGREESERVSADDLAEQTKVPRRYLNTVLQDLGRAGLVHSQSGPRGGHQLAQKSEKITILDVVNAVGELERIRGCPLGLPSHTSLCPLHQELDKVYATAQKALSNVTIAQILESTSPIIPLCDLK